MYIFPGSKLRRDIVVIVDFWKYQARAESGFYGGGGGGEAEIRVPPILGKRNRFWKATPFWESDTVCK